MSFDFLTNVEHTQFPHGKTLEGPYSSLVTPNVERETTFSATLLNVWGLVFCSIVAWGFFCFKLEE